MTELFPNGLSLKEVIKIPGKSFRDLSPVEIALMIEADSSLAKEGNSYFDSCALDEFLHCADLKGNEELQRIRKDILDKIYLDEPGSKNKKVNTEFLIKYAKSLRCSN